MPAVLSKLTECCFQTAHQLRGERRQLPNRSFAQLRHSWSGQLLEDRLSSNKTHHDRFARAGNKRAVSPRPADIRRLQAKAAGAFLNAAERRRIDEALKHGDYARRA